MKTLDSYLVKLIKAQGPLSIAGYMAEALGNDRHGYYMKQDPFGAKGDFTTAPEISQMFGEMIGLWHATNWLNMGSPAEIHLIELGPGRGTLMQDALRAMKVVHGLRDATRVHMVEMSPALRKIQQQNIPAELTPQWHNRIGDVFRQIDGAPVLLIANEFFDALPVRQFQKKDRGWHERLISLTQDEKLTWTLAPVPSPEKLIPAALHRAEEDSIAEICPVGENILMEISEYISKHGGAGIIADYGHDRHGTGDTLQALKSHEYCDILQDPGDADLTTHVNFQRLKEVAEEAGVRVYGPVGQGAFLKHLGIDARANTLMAQANATQKKDITAALHRLTDKAEMGHLFKVMALTDANLGGVIGFSTDERE